MQRISVELVPRSESQFCAEINQTRSAFPFIEVVNVPDLRRLELRSWEGCQLAAGAFPSTIPHIRAIDFSSQTPEPLFDLIDRYRFEEVLIISGDPPSAFVDGKQPGGTSLEMIACLHQQYPDLKIYGALDPYRSGIQAEVDYAHAKIAAGACGFFTQPFFDLRLAEIYYEQLAHLEMFWGVSPILTAKSESYWRRRNQAFFPRHFEPTLHWNQQFGREMLRFAQQSQGNIYFMPIKVDVVDYLAGVFADQIVLPETLSHPSLASVL